MLKDMGGSRYRLEDDLIEDHRPVSSRAGTMAD